jgi:hypothetical protein
MQHQLAAGVGVGGEDCDVGACFLPRVAVAGDHQYRIKRRAQGRQPARDILGQHTELRERGRRRRIGFADQGDGFQGRVRITWGAIVQQALQQQSSLGLLIKPLRQQPLRAEDAAGAERHFRRRGEIQDLVGADASERADIVAAGQLDRLRHH